MCSLSMMCSPGGSKILPFLRFDAWLHSTWGKGEWNMHDFCQKQIAGSAQQEAKKSWIPESAQCGDGDD